MNVLSVIPALGLHEKHMAFEHEGFLRYTETMSTALKNMRVGDLTAEQLEQAFERKLVQDGLDSLDRGEKVEATPEFFEQLRQLARDTAAKQK